MKGGAERGPPFSSNIHHKDAGGGKQKNKTKQLTKAVGG